MRNLTNYFSGDSAFGSRIFAVVVFTPCLQLSSWVQAAEFIPLGDLPGGEFQSSGNGVSADGTVVVGRSNSDFDGKDDGDTEAFRWTSETGMVGLGDFPGGRYRSRAYGVSADGSVVVGQGSDETFDIEAFRWTIIDGMERLGDSCCGVDDSEARGVSADGNVLVGEGTSTSGREGFRWTAESGITGVGDLPGGVFSSEANDVSADGSVAVGRSEGASGTEAFRWTEVGGMVGLGTLPGGFDSVALGVSKDGSVVVGWSSSASGSEAEAFRWTSAGGMVGLGDLPGGDFISRANAVSADGSVVVGMGTTGSEGDPGDPTIATGGGGIVAGNKKSASSHEEGFIWTQANGLQRLRDILEADGTTGLSGWGPLRPHDISDDGRWVTGEGINPSGFNEAFLVRLPASINGPFNINAGINDAWFNADTAGQGFFIIAFPDLKFMFLAWFTFETSLPDESIIANLGWAGHRWFTAGGSYSGDTAELEIEFTSGGVFDSIEPTVDQVQGGGTITVKFSDCENATVTYDIPSIARMDVVPIKRGLPDNVALCEELNLATK
jgi:probable HAF family extracellular repeat protein